MTQCIECGSVRPDYAPRCPCGSAHVAQAHPNEDTLTMESAWIYSPIACEDDVERIRDIREKRRKKVTVNDAPSPIEPYTLKLDFNRKTITMAKGGSAYRWDYRVNLPACSRDLDAYAVRFLDATEDREMSSDEIAILNELTQRIGWHVAWNAGNINTLERLQQSRIDRSIKDAETREAANTTP